jgi:hypothetical protein
MGVQKGAGPSHGRFRRGQIFFVGNGNTYSNVYVSLLKTTRVPSIIGKFRPERNLQVFILVVQKGKCYRKAITGETG